MKKTLVILAFFSIVTMLSSCHKDCVCQGYDGAFHTYSADEVDARGVTCSYMIFQSGQQFYAFCDWE